MKYINTISRARSTVLIFTLACVAAAALGVWRSSAVRREADAKQKFHESLRDGVGREVSFARQGGDPHKIRASVESAARFIFNRSGVRLSEGTKGRLAEMEARATGGAGRAVTPHELSEILAAVVLERISRMTEAEMEQAAETLRGFDAPDLPEAYRHRSNVRLRASYAVRYKPEQFVAQLKAIQRADAPTLQVFRAAANSFAETQVRSRVDFLSAALPEQFGAAPRSLTPVQALLITYSVVADDPLADSTPNLKKRMKALQERTARREQGHYPSPEGHFAFGVNGYLYSTPLNLTFDEQTVSDLLNRVEERSGSR